MEKITKLAVFSSVNDTQILLSKAIYHHPSHEKVICKKSQLIFFPDKLLKKCSLSLNYNEYKNSGISCFTAEYRCQKFPLSLCEL